MTPIKVILQLVFSAVMLCISSFSLADDTPYPWQAPLGQDHPLTGKIYSVKEQRLIEQPILLNRLAGTRYVVTGESHNNPDHHALQLEILKAMFANGRQVVVGAEVFTSKDQSAIDAYTLSRVPDPKKLQETLGWGKRRAPLWQQFEPIIAFTGDTGLPLFALDLDRRQLKLLKEEGLKVLPKDLVNRYQLDQPLPKTQQDILLYDLYKGHCGMLFTRNLDRLILAQRTRDATMAQRMLSADRGAGALLLVGYGHARADRGIPYLLDEKVRKGDLVNLLFASVKPELTKPDQYASWFGAKEVPFDYIWFTPRVDDEDPCDKLKRIYNKKAVNPSERPQSDKAK